MAKRMKWSERSSCIVREHEDGDDLYMIVIWREASSVVGEVFVNGGSVSRHRHVSIDNVLRLCEASAQSEKESRHA